VALTIYTKPGCPYCAAAKEDLQSRGIEYEEVDVYATTGARDTVTRLTGGQQVVPVLVDERGEVRIGFGGG
jgi:glutaredoxin